MSLMLSGDFRRPTRSAHEPALSCFGGLPSKTRFLVSLRHDFKVLPERKAALVQRLVEHPDQRIFWLEKQRLRQAILQAPYLTIGIGHPTQAINQGNLADVFKRACA
jgi:hypothetical protein